MASKHARDLKAVKKVRAEKAQEIQDLWDLETKEDRQLEQDERDQIHELTKALKELERQQEEIEANLELEKKVKEASDGIVTEPEEDITSKGIQFVNPQQFPERPKGLGDQFVGSKAYQDYFGQGKAPEGEWQMPTVHLESKATLSSGGTAGGAGPFYTDVPGLITPADAPMVVADLMPNNVASGPTIRYFQEWMHTNAAAGVLETAQKPESVFDFQAQTETLKKIATFVPVSDEMIEDSPAIQAYLNSRLSMFVRQEEERQLLHGSGDDAAEVVGFIDNNPQNSIGSATLTGGSVTAGAFGTLAGVLNNQRGSSYLDIDAIIMHPTKFGSIIAATDGNGQFYAGGPLAPGAYGAGRSVPLQPSYQGGWTLFGIPVYLTAAIGSATSTQTLLAGNFRQGAAVWRKGGVSVQASNQHSDFFRRNQTMIRAEERVALTVYRPEAFTVISWP